ncbi:MAG: hypothetical protein HN879_05170, partial [Flavobacteriaceae bacterium]|nr:hypothetical protein [Flavobacteriaceae bacterium]
MGFSILMLSMALVFNSIDVYKKELNRPVSEVEIVEVFNHSDWNVLLQQHVSEKGNVNYKGFKKDELKLKSYLTSLSKDMPNDSWSKDGK